MSVRKLGPSEANTGSATVKGDRRKPAARSEDAVALQQRLNREITRQQPATPNSPAPADKVAKPEPELHPAADRRQQSDDRRKPPARSYSKVIKSIVGIAVVGVVGYMPVQRLFETSSVQAVMNATIVTVRSPINGVVSGSIGQLNVGTPVEVGKPLVMLENSRVDTGKLDHATEMVATRSADLEGVRQRIASLEDIQKSVASRVATYRLDRETRLAARIDEANARITQAKAERDLVDAELGRITTLVDKNITAKSERQEMSLRLIAANARVDEVEAAKAVLKAEQEALSAGRFLGDDYNDAPRAAQRVDDIQELLVQLRADESRMESLLGSSQDQLIQESEQLNPQRFAAMDAPVGGRVWEILTAPGEQVVAGQHLLSLVDCSKLIVTAAVSESVYNFLSLGRDVQFKMDGSNIELPGTVVQLSGTAAAGSNFAIDPSALTKEAYRVGISVDAKLLGNACPVGRTGRVVFKKS